MRAQFLAEAVTDLDAALTHYREHGGQALAERFLAQVHGLIDLVATHPDIGHVDTLGVRRFGLKRFPFDLVFRVDGERLIVVAIVHHRRRPRYWLGRLNPGGE